MTRKLIYTPDAAGEYTIAGESENWVTDIGQVDTESDARLFCAAPDLLEALQGVVNKWTFGTAYNAPEFVAARAAIAKALGETK